jgi:hypothetical protein
MTSRNVPSSNGVSAGPIMTAFLRSRKLGMSVGDGVTIPRHNIVCDGRSGYSSGRVGLHALHEQVMLALQAVLGLCT